MESFDAGVGVLALHHPDRPIDVFLGDAAQGLLHLPDQAVVALPALLGRQPVRLFGVPARVFHRLKATHLGAGPEDPYAVLDVAPGATDEELRAAWKRALSEAHPDRVLARGLPAEFVDVAHVKSAAINAAYDTINRDRKGWNSAGA